ncbi:MAG: Fe-S cluster assembly protein SufD [Elusimicrobia bacterium]|nr:Fe-S cluster assembly protein SufD [Elusimicrobiota bacterium]
MTEPGVLAELPESGAIWLRDLRRDALDRFSKLGLPGPSEEDWRHTSVAPIAEGRFRRARLPEAYPEPAFRDWSGSRLVFVNGRYVPGLSSARPGARVVPMSQMLQKDGKELEPWLKETSATGAFAALNTALFEDGAYIEIDGSPVEPVHIVFLSAAQGEPAAAHVRVMIRLSAGSRAVIVEEYLSPGGTSNWTNSVAQIKLSENASLEHIRVQRDGAESLHVGLTEVRQARDSRYASRAFSFGGRLVRHDLDVRLEGEGAECQLDGLYFLKDSDHVDNHTRVDHAKPHTTSRELYKGVLDGVSRAVFNGAIVVRPNAQKISSVQSNKNLLLSSEGLVHTKPEFKIYANDVQCKHGATIGQLSSEALFYLRSRGIDETEARRLLVYAFVGEMVSRVGMAGPRQALAEELWGG